MTDHCINFLPYQVRAALDGRLSQTRRVLKYDKCGAPIMPAVEGDRLWVREAHYLTDDGDAEAVVYAEDTSAAIEHRQAIMEMKGRYNLTDKWATPHLRLRSPIHMPRWASRTTLVVTDVRVQRVQDISAADVSTEGVKPIIGPNPKTMKEAFRDLWNSIYGPDAWDQNPWVAAITFDVHKCNIDQMEGAG